MNKWIYAAALLLPVAVPAHAATIIQSQSITPFNATNVTFEGQNNGGLSPVTSSLLFNKFDTTLGTLNSITLTFTSTLNALGTVTRTAGGNTARTYAYATGTNEAFTAGGFNLAYVLGGGSPTFTIPAKDGTLPLAVNATATGSQTLTSGFGSFLGVGPAPALNVVTTSLFKQLGDPPGTNCCSSKLDLSSFSVNGTATLTYDYVASATAVPEPSTWALSILGIGAIGTGMRRRRRVTKAFA